LGFQPAAADDGQERIRQDQFIVVTNARQGFVVADRVLWQAENGLVMQLDHAGSGQGLKQRAGLAAGHQRLRGPFGVIAIEGNAVATRLLGGIHGDVGLLGQIVDVLHLLGGAEGNADADADGLIDAQIAKMCRLEQALAALCDLLGLGRGGARQEGGEFVAAQAIQAIVGAQRHHQRI